MAPIHLFCRGAQARVPMAATALKLLKEAFAHRKHPSSHKLKETANEMARLWSEYKENPKNLYVLINDAVAFVPILQTDD